MKKKIYKFILSISALLLLFSCNDSINSNTSNNTSNEQSSSQISSNENTLNTTSTSNTLNDTSISTSTEIVSSSNSSSSSETNNNQTYVSFSSIDEVIKGALNAEVYNTSSVEITKSSTTGEYTYIEQETFKMFTDNSSQSEGNLSLYVGGEKLKVDNFKKRTEVTKDKIEVDGLVNNYDMFVMVKDYEQDIFAPNINYLDSASKVYIVNSEEEASNASLNDNQYVLRSDVLLMSSSYQLPLLYEFIAYNLIANNYVQQIGVSSFVREIDSQSVTYSCLASYSLEGDLNDIQTITTDVSFKLNKSEDRLLNAFYQIKEEDVSKSDPTDKYVSITSTSVVMNYGSREEKPSDVLNVNDYFLETVEDVEILCIDNYGDRVPVESEKFPITSNYLFAHAKTYTPLKALDISISNLNSSNEKVIEMESSYFHVLDIGDTTLSFSYFGKDIDGVYREKIVTKKVTVVEVPVESVSILPSNNGIESDTIEKGKSYKLSIFVSPSKANQEVTVSVSNENIFTAVVDSNNDVIITGVNAGSAELTVYSKKDPTKYVTKTYYVAGDLNYSEIICSKTYVHNSIYGYTFTMTFNSDGTGERIEYVSSSNKSYTDTFTYHIDGIKIYFDSFSEGAPRVFDYATILKSGTQIDAYCSANYATYSFTESN